MPRAYVVGPVVIRTINVSGNGVDTLHVDGHRFRDRENRLRPSDGQGRAGARALGG
jgi:hypothetical protein